jgi:hypothetical protein
MTRYTTPTFVHSVCTGHDRYVCGLHFFCQVCGRTRIAMTWIYLMTTSGNNCGCFTASLKKPYHLQRLLPNKQSNFSLNPTTYLYFGILALKLNCFFLNIGRNRGMTTIEDLITMALQKDAVCYKNKTPSKCVIPRLWLLGQIGSVSILL